MYNAYICLYNNNNNTVIIMCFSIFLNTYIISIYLRIKRWDLVRFGLHSHHSPIAPILKMVIFHSYVSLPEGTNQPPGNLWLNGTALCFLCEAVHG